jgi:plasmid stabilization system protein ParE
MRATLDRMTANPLAFAGVHGDVRRAVMRQFPFGIYFRIAGNDIVVIAAMHGRRHPRRWAARR